VAHRDCLFEEGDERAGCLGKPAVGGLVPVDGEIVGGVTLGAGEGLLKDAGEGAYAQLADWVSAGADGGDSQVHFGWGTLLRHDMGCARECAGAFGGNDDEREGSNGEEDVADANGGEGRSEDGLFQEAVPCVGERGSSSEG